MTPNEPEAEESVVEKRARFERMSMTVLSGEGSGRINVRNDSYGDDSGSHIYNVRVVENEPVECTCPADEYQSGPCKHRVAVSDRPIVLSSAQAASQSLALTDGGTTKTDDGDTCDRCPTLLEDAHNEPAGYTVKTTDGEELCPECADARSLCEQGFHADCDGECDGGQTEDNSDGPITVAQYRDSRDKTKTTGVVDLE